MRIPIEAPGNFNMGWFSDTAVIADGLVGDPVFVRSFNATSADLASFYGNTDIANLPGANPLGEEGITGTIVLLTHVGADGVAQWPGSDGQVTGDDAVVQVLRIGDGIAPGLTDTGRMSVRVYPAPPAGTRLYARAFNAATIEDATYWTQSATFVLTGVEVMDLSALGLWKTCISKGVDPHAADSDGDGATDAEELIANADSMNVSDTFVLQAGARNDVRFEGRAGRSYVLQRTTDLRPASPEWTPVASSQMLGVGAPGSFRLRNRFLPPDRSHALTTQMGRDAPAWRRRCSAPPWGGIHSAECG